MKNWDATYAELLRASREARGLDRFQLARLSTVTTTHITQLEEGGDSAFYSPALKLATGRRVLCKLGVALPEGADPQERLAPVSVSAPVPVAEPQADPTVSSARTSTCSVKKESARAAATPVWLSARTGKSSRGLVMGLAVATCVTVVGLIAWPSVHGPTSASGLQVATTQRDLSAQVTTEVVRLPAVAEAQSQATVVRALAEPFKAASSVTEQAAESAHAGCPWSSQPAKVSGPVLDKPDTYVHLRARGDVQVCVMDGFNRVTRVLLRAGEERSVFGNGPWQLSSDQLDRVSVFYRGGRVRGAEPAQTSHWLIVSAGSSNTYNP